MITIDNHPLTQNAYKALRDAILRYHAPYPAFDSDIGTVDQHKKSLDKEHRRRVKEIYNEIIALNEDKKLVEWLAQQR